MQGGFPAQQRGRRSPRPPPAAGENPPAPLPSNRIAQPDRNCIRRPVCCRKVRNPVAAEVSGRHRTGGNTNRNRTAGGCRKLLGHQGKEEQTTSRCEDQDRPPGRHKMPSVSSSVIPPGQETVLRKDFLARPAKPSTWIDCVSGQLIASWYQCDMFWPWALWQVPR